MNMLYLIKKNCGNRLQATDYEIIYSLLEEMVLFRTRNGSIPFYLEPEMVPSPASYMELQNGSI